MAAIKRGLAEAKGYGTAVVRRAVVDLHGRDGGGAAAVQVQGRVPAHGHWADRVLYRHR